MSGTGTALLDFGASPASDASVVVVGQSGILSASSLVEAWINYAATTDHTADEHLVEPLRVIAGSIVDGVGFTIYGVCDTQGAFGKFSVSWAWY